VRLALISDIHANLPALEAVLDDISRRSVHRTLSLGDIVGYGAWPNECCDLVREHKILSVLGNHDLAAVKEGAEHEFTAQARQCILWTREHLTERNQRMLKSLPDTRKVESVTLCHGSLVERDEYVYTWRGALPSFEVLTTRIGFLGHTHYACWFYYEFDPPRGDGETRPQGGLTKVGLDGSYLANPGAVGQPRDGNPDAAYAIYDDQLEEIQFHRVAYDVEAAAKAIIDAGLPPGMGVRLFEGM
jgi:predicted phosphodiesterase